MSTPTRGQLVDPIGWQDSSSDNAGRSTSDEPGVVRPVRVDNLVITLVTESYRWNRCALFPEQHWIHRGEVAGMAWWYRGCRRHYVGWICSACLVSLPGEPKGSV